MEKGSKEKRREEEMRVGQSVGNEVASWEGNKLSRKFCIASVW